MLIITRKTNMDWAGKVLEAITGQTLGQYSKENIFDKVGCKDLNYASLVRGLPILNCGRC